MDNKLIYRDITTLDNDFFIGSGDFGFAESDEQHIIDICISFPGEWKQTPAVGVGLLAFLASSGQEQAISRDIRVQLSADGYQVKSPDFKISANGDLIVAPHAIR